MTIIPFSNIQCVHAEYIWLFPVTFISICFIWYRLYWRVTTARHIPKRLWRYFSVTTQYIKGLLLTLTCIMLHGALLQPYLPLGTEQIVQESRDIMIGLDISGSMRAQDVDENRLACAKKKIKTLLTRLACDRVGLLLFSGSSFIQCPFTSDHRAFEIFLDAVDVETISSGTTAIDQAIRLALTTCKKNAGRKRSLIVLCTDGEDFSQNLSGVKEEALREHAIICALGIGSTNGAPIPLYDLQSQCIGHQTDNQGNVVITRLNEQLLQKLAHDTGGIYVRATEHTDQDVDRLLQMIKTIEKKQFSDQTIERRQELYIYPVVISFLLLIIEWLL